MNVQQVYAHYKIPLNLQQHMLRVAALSQVLIENWKNEKFDKESIALACLFHDMANIIKYDFSKTDLFKEEKNEVEYWKMIQEETIKKYGNNIHKATIKICHEINLPDKVIQLVENLEWNNAMKAVEQKDFESAICIYSDMRIGPFGILLLQDRLINLRTRDKSYDFISTSEAAKQLEKILQNNISIRVNFINNSDLNCKFNNLSQILV